MRSTTHNKGPVAPVIATSGEAISGFHSTTDLVCPLPIYLYLSTLSDGDDNEGLIALKVDFGCGVGGGNGRE